MDLVKARVDVREWYENFVKGFHRNDIGFIRNINLKYDHTERVVIETRGIAQSLGLDNRDINLLIIAACLHDVGRYQQLADFDTFDDKESCDHAELSAKIVESSNVLRLIPVEEHEHILNAIRQHNKYKLDTSLPEKSQLFAQIIRDADKIDILRLLSQHYCLSKEERNNAIELNLPEGDAVSSYIMKDINATIPVFVETLNNVTELKLLQLSWVFDLNFLWTHQVLNKRGYVAKIAKTLPKTLSGNWEAILEYHDQKALEAKESGLKGR